METRTAAAEFTGPAHERVYRSLRQAIMHGDTAPGRSITIRGIAAQYGVSMTPAREAARRLAAEGALALTSSGRARTPTLDSSRIEELCAVRALLEPALAERALPRVHGALISRLRGLNDSLRQRILERDASGYIRGNLEFHRTLYLRAQSPAMLAIVETVWLQLGPTLASLYQQADASHQVGSHAAIIARLAAGDEAGLRQAVREDVTKCLQMLRD